MTEEISKKALERAAVAREKVSALLAPRNIVIAGASDKGHSWSRSAFRNLKRYGFPNPVYPFNPGRDEVWGEKCYRDLASLPEKPDHLVVVVPAPHVAPLLVEAAARGARSATIFTAGFDEAEGEAAEKLTRELRETIAKTGLAVSGPNCLGNLAAPSKLMTMTDGRAHDMLPGPVAIVAQSGGVGTAIKRTLNDRGLRAGYLLTIGNQAGLTAADYICYFAAEPDIKVIVCYLEAIHSGADFLDACRIARAAGKPVVVMKLGGSREGRAAAMAHTGALAGTFEAFDAAAGAAGAVRVKTLDDAIEATEFFLHAPLPRGRGVGALTFSGGLRGLLIDAAAANDVTLPPLAEDTKQKLRKILGVGTIIGNPLDAGFAALSSQENYIEAIRVTLADPAIDVLLLQEEILREAGHSKESNLARVNAMVASGEVTKPLAFCSMISYHFTDYSRDLRARLPNTPFLQEPDKSMRALRSVIDYVAARDFAARVAGKGAPVAETDMLRRARAMAKTGESTSLDEAASKAFLRDCGVPAPREIVAANVNEAVAAAASIGYPVVLKIVSADIAHKSDAGGVRLDIGGPEDLRRAHAEIMASVTAFKPGARIEGVLVAPFVRGGLELAMGVTHDPDVGCVVMFGSGGVWLELMKDATFGPPGIDEQAANEMIDRTRAGKLLAGYRGAGAHDRQCVVDALVALGRVARDFGDVIEAIDINPFVALEAGRGGVALDGLVILRKH